MARTRIISTVFLSKLVLESDSWDLLWHIHGARERHRNQYRERDWNNFKQYVLVPAPVLDQSEHFYTVLYFPILSLSLADPEFSREGCAKSQIETILQFFLPKTVWKWKNLDPQGCALPLDPPMTVRVTVPFRCSVIISWERFFNWFTYAINVCNVRYCASLSLLA